MPLCDQKLSIEPKLFKHLGTEYVGPSTYSSLFTENIGQCVRYIIEIHIIKLINETLDNSMFFSQKWVESVQYFL